MPGPGSLGHSLRRTKSSLSRFIENKNGSSEREPLLESDEDDATIEAEGENYFATISQHKETKSGSKNTLKAYIEKLYETIKTNPDECFVSGAFVIADKDNALSEILSGGITLNLTNLKLESHTAFKTKINPKKNKDQPIYENWMLGDLTYMMECECGNTTAKRPARNVKWYKFTGLDNNQYIYMKLEDWPTVHHMHLGQALSRYILKKPNTSCVQPRREDCKHLERESQRKSQIESTRLISGESAEACHIDIDENEPNYGRVGDEYFVNQELNTKILSPITSRPSSDWVSKIEWPERGGRKTRKHKRKTLKLKHTRRVRRRRSKSIKKLKKYSRRK
jgi:hypothetical protein